MQSPLDNPAIFKKYDKHRVWESIEALPKQCAQAWQEASRIKLPASYRNPKNIVVAAMGGSGLGARMIKSVFAQELQVPFELVNHYTLPAYIGRDTLVFLVSYSGTTEEVLAAAEDARKRGAKIVGITRGGALGKWLAAHKVPRYIFEPRHNPSGQPRLGTGYTMMGMLAILQSVTAFHNRNSARLQLRLGDPQGSHYSSVSDSAASYWRTTVPTVQNSAKQLALKLQNRGVLIFASEHLVGNAHALANQINESAKQFAVSFVIPEMNHHLIEGLTFPQLNRRTLAGLFLESGLYHPRVAVRYPITKEVLVKQYIPAFFWSPKSATRFDQALETLSFGSFLSFYLAMLNRLDPSAIKWVDYFKSRLM